MAGKEQSPSDVLDITFASTKEATAILASGLSPFTAQIKETAEIVFFKQIADSKLMRRKAK